MILWLTQSTMYFFYWVVMDTDASRALPEFGEVEISSLPDGTTFEDIKSLQSLYREHCEVRKRDSTKQAILPLNPCYKIQNTSCDTASVSIPPRSICFLKKQWTNVLYNIYCVSKKRCGRSQRIESWFCFLKSSLHYCKFCQHKDQPWLSSDKRLWI